MILFVAVNLLLTIYRLLNRKWREGLENVNDGCGTGSYCKTWMKPPVCYGSDKPCNAPAATHATSQSATFLSAAEAL